MQPAAILRESLPEDLASHQGASQSSIDHIELATLGYDFSVWWKVATMIANKKNIFLILDTIGIGETLWAYQNIPADCNVKIINLWVGISWVQNKHSIENNDIALIDDLLPIYEPIDATQCMQYLNAPSSMYTRIVNDEIVDTLFTGEYETLYAERDIPMTSFGYSGISGTIIVQPGLLVTMTQTLQYLQTEKSVWFDLFVQTWPRSVYSQRLVDSLHHTWKLIVLHDQISDDAVRAREAACSKASALHGELAVAFKHPDYTKITTILPEYMYEQIGYTPESLAHYLLSIS